MKTLFLVLLFVGAVFAQNAPVDTIYNPVIPGFYPDPSVCRVGEDYYLVTSTFEYFPGVPVFHSKDLVHWRQIGHCLTREEQLPLKNARSSGGIFAPTMRYHEGTFYMITTSITGKGNFYVTATDPAGPWSNPIDVDQGGIDPSLFFDKDGTVYLTTNGGTPWQGRGIYQSEIDIKTGERLSDILKIWPGTGGRYPEAPHLYRINNWYYLMIAEGGTEYGHMETIARSRSAWGPFESYSKNPILTHRNRGGHPIQGTGHADLIQAHDGSWWMLFLAFRPIGGQFHQLGRETFLAPVSWNDDGWPVVNESGTLELKTPAKVLPAVTWPKKPVRDDFDSDSLDVVWNFVFNPNEKDWSLTERKDWLRLHGSAVTMYENQSPAFIGRRQQHFNFRAATQMDFQPQQDNEEAGLVLRMNNNHHYFIGVSRQHNERLIFIRYVVGRIVSTPFKKIVADGPIKLVVSGTPAHYSFSYSVGGREPVTADSVETRYLTSEVAGGFTGVYIGMYATGNGKPSTAPADFNWFDYKGYDKKGRSYR